jgi:hypothetical protein
MRAHMVSAFAALMLSASPAFAYKVQIGEDMVLNLDFLLQVQASFVENGAPSGEHWSKDFFVRRSRILLFGELTKSVSFFVETDQVNFGKNGDFSSPFFIQDAFMSFKPFEDLSVDAGLILLPFTRHSYTGAIALNGVDYHSKLIKFPEGSTKIFRDVGVQLRTVLLDKKLQARVGVFGGSQGVALEKGTTGQTITVSNPEDLPRVTAHARYALLGTEADLFPKGIYFTKEPMLSVGVGVDFVPSAVLEKKAVVDGTGAVTTKAELGDHLGMAADVFLDLPIGEDHELVFQATFLYYASGTGAKSSGLGLLTEAGYRIGSFEPVVAFDYFQSDADAADLLAIHTGLNWWIAKHQSNLKLDFGAEKAGDLGSADFVKSLTLQGHLFF